MGRIQTVLGSVDSETMGPIDIHDHVVRFRGKEVSTDAAFLMNDPEKATDDLKRFYDAGGRCMVDAQPLGGRAIEILLDVARRSPVHLVGTTGFHLDSLYYNDFWGRYYSLEDIVPLLVAEVTEGIDLNSYCGPLVRRSTAKAGACKIATSYQVIHPTEAKWARAVARTHMLTGVPIITHADVGTMALELVDILTSEGVDPQHVVLGHLDRNPDIGYHVEVAKTGAFIQYDGASRVKYYPDSVVARLIFDMVEKGFGNQLILAGDMGKRPYLPSYGGGPGYDYILKTFLPRLRREGLPENVIQALVVNNPRRALSFAEIPS